MSTGGRGSQSLKTEPPLSLGLPPDRDAPIMSGGLDPDVHTHRPDVATGGELGASLLPGQSDDARGGLIPWRNLRDAIEDRKSNTSELQSLMRISYAVFCLIKKKQNHIHMKK